LNKLERLGGLHRLRPSDNSRASRFTKTVNRPYGGYFTGGDLKDRIIRAFITEEIKEVKKRLQKAAVAPKKSKGAKKGTKKTTKK
jgi:large subunit ribosomal protein L34e